MRASRAPVSSSSRVCAIVLSHTRFFHSTEESCTLPSSVAIIALKRFTATALSAPMTRASRGGGERVVAPVPVPVRSATPGPSGREGEMTVETAAAPPPPTPTTAPFCVEGGGANPPLFPLANPPLFPLANPPLFPP